MMDRKVALDYGAVAVGNRSLKIIQDKLQQAYVFLNENDPLSAKVQYNFQYNFQRNKWLINIMGLVILTCDKNNFYLQTNIIAKYNHLNIFRKNKIYKIKRKGF